MKKHAVVLLSLLWMVVLVAGVSVSLTLTLSARDGYAQQESVSVSQEDAERFERYRRLDEVYERLMERYFEQPDSDALIQGAIDGMLASLNDPFTYYYTVDELRSQNEMMTGEYRGLGMKLSVSDDKSVMVTRVYRDSPAAVAGIKNGDVLVAVNGEVISAQNGAELSALIAHIATFAEDGVSLSLRRDDEIYETSMANDMVIMNNVEYQLLDGQIGYIRIYEFMGDCVDGFNRAVSSLLKQDMRALIIDLRDNPGGLLDDVVAIADVLLPEGLIVYTEERDGQRENFYSAVEMLGKPLVLLVDGDSASASEVLAGAVQDYGIGTIIGKTTYGKGIVQTLLVFEDDEGMQLTTSRYFTPKGRSIHGVGIIPDIEVSLENDFDPSMSDPSPELDAQLAEAIRTLRTGLDAEAAS